MAQGAVGAVLGYAIGTAQILGLDWFRARWAHARQLRLLRADLRRISAFRAKFGLSITEPPDSDRLPRAPTISSTFVPTVAAIDFWITDEHRDDNSQEGLLGVADGLVALAEIHRLTMNEIDKARCAVEQSEKRDHLERAVAFANDYDYELDYIQYLVADSLRDIDRRLNSVQFTSQVKRLGRDLPIGTNPAPLTRGDPRITADSPKAHIRHRDV